MIFEEEKDGKNEHPEQIVEDPLADITLDVTNSSEEDELKVYKCGQCSKLFYTLSNLINHRKIHKEKQYSYKNCEKIFAQNDYLKNT